MFSHDQSASIDERRRRGAASWLLSGASALAICSLLAAPAYAQDDDDDDEEVIVVRGIRGSLMNSQEIKREADVFVDSVTALDIGALPDRSVTEAIQRIPGVAIDRFDAGRDPDHFSVEGSGVVVRGLTFVRSELNGRDTFSANNGRALSFADVPAELMAGVDVFKSPSADIIEGGIAGTVNLRTRVPFDAAGRLLSGSIEGNYSDFAEEWTPTISGLVSDRWDTDLGEFGILLNYVDSELKSRADGQQASNFGCREDFGGGPSTCQSGNAGVWFPRGAAFRTQEFDRERKGYAAAFQWESPDNTAIATAQFLRSEATQAWTEHAIEIATDNVANNGDSRPVAGATFEFGDDGIFTSGVITGTTGWRSDQFTSDPRTPIDGLQSNNIRRDVLQEYVTTDYGLNFRWTPTDNWAFNFDYQYVESTVDVLDAGIWGSTYQNLALQMRGEDAPIFRFLPPGAAVNGDDVTDPVNCVDPPNAPSNTCPTYYNPPHDSFSDPYNSFWRSSMDHIEESEGEENALRFDAEHRFLESGWIDAVRVGARWSERDQTTRFSTYNWGVLSEQWGGGGPVWFDDPVDGDLNTSGGEPTYPQTELFAFDNFFRGEVPIATGGEPRPFYASNIVDNYDEYVAFGLLVAGDWDRAPDPTTGCSTKWVPLAMRCGVTPGTPFLPSEINPVLEETQALYGMVTFDHALAGGQNVSGNLGMRFVATTRDSAGGVAFPLRAYSTDQDCLQPAGNPPAFCALTPEVRQQARNWANGAFFPDTAKVEYDFWLPSLNVKYDLNDEMLLRFGASKTISLPELGLVRNYANMVLETNDTDVFANNNGRPIAVVGAGNPLLTPITSINLDASFEWYYDAVGSFTVSLFYKELEDVLTNSTQRIPVTNNGETFDVILSTPVNSPDTGKLKGFEIAYQQFYDDFLPPALEGLGLNANYTYIDSSGVPQSTLSETDPDVAAGRVANVDTSLLPLQGLSEHNFNIAGIYERGPVSARLAYNWRSEFLLTVRDVIVPFAPIMNDDTGQLDGSIFYDINDNVQIGLQAVNLTNEITHTKQVLDDDLLLAGRSWFMNDRRFTLVARATF